MFPRASLFLLLSCSYFLLSSALDTAIYSSRDRDATSAAEAAARGLEAAATTAPPTATTPPPSTNASSSPPPTLSSATAATTPLPVLLGRYDPCSEPGPATKGRALYLGLALWPGGTPEAWGPPSSLSKPSSPSSSAGNSGGADDFDDASLNPCRLAARSNAQDGSALPSAAATLAAAGVLIAPFAIRIDSVAALRVGGALQRRALELAAAAADAAAAMAGGGNGDGSSSTSSSSALPSPVVSAVLFRGARVRSEARIVASADPGVSFGTGFVQALAAEVFFENGQLSRIEWPELGCAGCGGRGSRDCVQSAAGRQASCAVNSTFCSSSSLSSSPSPSSPSSPSDANGNPTTLEEGCGLTIYAGFSGDDRRGVPLTSGAGVRSIGARSAVSLLDAIAQRVRSIVSGAAGGGYIGELQGGDGGAA